MHKVADLGHQKVCFADSIIHKSACMFQGCINDMANRDYRAFLVVFALPPFPLTTTVKLQIINSSKNELKKGDWFHTKKFKKIHFNIDSTQFANLIQHFNIGTEVAKIVFHSKIKYFHFKFSVYLQITNVVRSFFLVFFYTKSFPSLEYICSSFF